MLWQRIHTQLVATVILVCLPQIVQGSSLAAEILDGFNDAVDCAKCHSLLATLRATAFLGDDALTRSLKALCNRLKIEDADVCGGVFDNAGPVIAHDLRSISPFGQTSTRFCNAMLGLCTEPPVNNYVVPFPKPAPENPKVFRSSGRPPFSVVHFSDAHIDREYSTGSEANCSKPLCCREFSDQSDPATIPAGPLGNHRCDTPRKLSQSAAKAIDAKNSSFSIFTGDIVDGAVWLVNEEEVTTDINLFSEEFRTVLRAPVFPTLGNHESSPVNCFPRSTTQDHANDSQWVYDTSSIQWLPWIGRSAANQVIHHSGSYSLVASGTNLRVISFNSDFWYKMNLWLYDSEDYQPDPNGILSFLIEQLQLAEDLGQRVWIIAHMPPGGGDVFLDQSNYYDQVIQRYKNTIAGQFFGHTHSDEFQLAYSNYSDRTMDTVTSMAWIAPALTPRSGNPAFVVYDVDPDTYEIMDAKTYSTNLSHPDYHVEPIWNFLYSARDVYGSLIPDGLSPSDSLSPSFWHQVTELFETNPEAFRMFQRFRQRLGRDGCRYRGDDDEGYISCRRRAICQLRAQRSQDNCAGSNHAVEWSWRDSQLANYADAHECEAVGGGAILRQIVDAVARDKLDDSTKDILQAQLSDIILPAQERYRSTFVASDSSDAQKIMQVL